MIRGIAGQFRRARVYRDKGATAVEYAFIAALIAAVIIAGVTLVGAATSDNFGTVNF
jgi:pilus assembly protein Flp/PilA